MSGIKAVTVDQATIEQLKQFAVETMGLDPSKLTDRTAILSALVVAGWDQSSGMITVHDRPAVGARGKIETKAAKAPAGEEKNYWDQEVVIQIDKTDTPDGAQPVYVNVNGIGMLIERGKPQKIKRKYLHALGNAVRTVYDQEDAKSPLIPREVTAYPWRQIA